jgi:hypothetical protein
MGGKTPFFPPPRKPAVISPESLLNRSIPLRKDSANRPWIAPESPSESRAHAKPTHLLRRHPLCTCMDDRMAVRHRVTSAIQFWMALVNPAFWLGVKISREMFTHEIFDFEDAHPWRTTAIQIQRIGCKRGVVEAIILFLFKITI